MVNKFVLAAFLFALSINAPAYGGPLDDGLAAHRRGDFTAAFKLLRPLAEAGVTEAELALGIMYYTGKGATQDDVLAIKWYRSAAEKGNAKAQNNLGSMYETGRGIQKSYSEAARWYGLAAAQGHPLAEGKSG